MPGAETHARDGTILGVTLAIGSAAGVFYLYNSTFLAILAAPIAFILGFGGTMFPDIDINSSIPYRWFIRGLTASGAVAIGYVVWHNWQLYIDLLQESIGSIVPPEVPVPAIGLVLVGVTIPVVKVVAEKGVDRVTGSHRSRTHDPILMLALAAGVVGILWILLPEIQLFERNIRPIIAVGAPTALFLGTLVHVGRDKIS